MGDVCKLKVFRICHTGVCIAFGKQAIGRAVRGEKIIKSNVLLNEKQLSTEIKQSY